MRKFILGLALSALLTAGGCRAIYSGVWKAPKWVGDKVFNMYTDNGHFDGETRWNNFTRNYQQIENFVDIHFFNYDIRDPYLGSPFFGDPR